MPLKICLVAAEAAPLAKTGGLADVSAALAGYLHRHGHDVRLFIPLYSSIASKIVTSPVDAVRDVAVQFGPHSYRFSLHSAQLPDSAAEVFFVSCPALFDRSSLYTNSWDEHLRFLLLQRAVLESCQRMGFAPDIIHCNDWHTALLPLLLKSIYAWDRLFERSKTVLTIHNIGYQGVFSAYTVGDLGLGGYGYLLHQDDLRKGQINWLKHGILYADCVSTVSPTYAREICTAEGGYGLEGDLRARAQGVQGILNGVDYAQWNPATDIYLPYHYDPAHLERKALVKAATLTRVGLSAPVATPLLGIVSRMTGQKGFDLLFNTLPEILAARDACLIAVGSGESYYEDFFAGLQLKFPERVAYQGGYHEELAHLVEGASDMFLMPSLYEPCGLNQMYSLKYGTVPIVRRTGGLADSVQQWDPQRRTGTGIVFDHFDAPAMRWAIHTALDLYQDATAWKQVMLNGMAQDFSWERAGREYETMYEGLGIRD